MIAAWNGFRSNIFSIMILFMFKCNVFMKIKCCPSQYTRQHGQTMFLSSVRRICGVSQICSSGALVLTSIILGSSCYTRFWSFRLLHLYVCNIAVFRFVPFPEYISSSLGYSIVGLNVLYAYFYSIRIRRAHRVSRSVVHRGIRHPRSNRQ